MTMTRIPTQKSRKIFPLAALAVGALVLAAAPVSLGTSGFVAHQAFASGEGDHGSDKGGSDKGGAEGSGADRGADKGSADKGSADKGSADAGGTGGASADSASHDTTDR
jgi:hypothetical protein